MYNGDDEKCLGIGRFGLGLFPLFMRDLGGLMMEEEDTFLIADDDVGIFFVQDLSRHDLCADAGIVVDEIGDEVSLAFGRANEFEPVKDGWIVGFGIGAVRTMRPEAFAGDDIFETV